MRKRIFWILVFFSSAILLFSAVFFLAICQRRISENFAQGLDTEARCLAAGIELNGVGYLRRLAPGEHRISWIAHDGKVLYDSALRSEMPNQGSREEVAAAFRAGAGHSRRLSQSLGEESIYRAIRLSDGSVVRVSGSVSSMMKIIWGMLPALLGGFAVCLIIAAWLGARMSASLVAPIRNIDPDKPEQASTYGELTPLLRRLFAQKSQIALQMRELAGKQEIFETLVSGMAEGLILLDAAGRVLSSNPAAGELAGSEPLRPGQRFLAINRNEQLWAAVDQARKGGHGHALIRQGKRWIQVQASGTPGHLQDAGPCLLLLMDVTEKEERENLRREFSANVSHELKTPLTSISGIAEIMKDGLIRPEDLRHFAATMHDETNRLIRLVDDILRLSRLDEGMALSDSEWVDADLRMLAENCLSRLKALAANRNIKMIVKGESAMVRCVPGMLEELIFDLCENAIKYNIDGGEVRIGIYSATENDGSAVLEVADSGIGIPPHLRDRVFERFYQVDKSRSGSMRGSGLGLSIVRHIALLHHARVELLDNEPVGTMARVIFSK